MKRYYFDYAASTPVDPVVLKAMAPFWAEKFGNPGSLHSFGQEASAAVFEARDTIAKSLGCHYSEIVFTGSATEANNLALKGVVKSLKLKAPTKVGEPTLVGFQNVERAGSDKTSRTFRPKVITSAIEHDSILGTCRELEKDGVEVVYLPVSKNGIVDLKKLESALDDRTVLVSIMYANNEIGVVQPISEVAKIVSDFRNRSNAGNVRGVVNDNSNKRASPSDRTVRTFYPLFHTDAVQAFNYLNCNINDLGVDLLTLSSQKIYGPKGVGMLYVRNVVNDNLNKRTLVRDKISRTLEPLITGGGQENGMRAGTENVPGIFGFAKAVELTDKIRAREGKRLFSLQEYFLKEVKKINSKIELNGDAKNRLPNNINLYIPTKSGNKGSAQDLVIALDMAGFAVSPGSACSARVCSPSHVLKALGHSDEKAMSGLRITFGRQTDRKVVDALLKELKKKLK